MREYDLIDLTREFTRLGYKWYNFHVIGVRAANHVPDAFGDKIFVVWGSAVYSFSATTIPGVHWLQNLMNKKGTAVVAPGQYEDAYEIGLHKGNPALIQAKAIKVYRDNDLDNQAEEIGEAIEAGPECRIDIHGASKNIVSVIVGKWSAGCQVINNKFDEFMNLCGRSTLKKFTYALLEEFEPKQIT
jgi:hypothetical protein